MSKPTDLGMNRTGIQTSPLHSKEAIEGAAKSTPSSPGNELGLLEVRMAYSEDSDPIGSMPPPGTLKGMAKAAVKALQGQKPTVFLDKLGERLAFERTGTRLYEGLLSKFDIFGTWQGGPSRADLERQLQEELAHFELLRQCLEQLGADPTAVTPSADVAAVIAMGIIAVIGDARTDLKQSLEAMLSAELTDNDCWENLIHLARAAGQDEMVQGFQQALLDEQRHLRNVRAWITAGVGREAHAPMPGAPPPA